jgi:hypothetical protein
MRGALIFVLRVASVRVWHTDHDNLDAIDLPTLADIASTPHIVSHSRKRVNSCNPVCVCVCVYVQPSCVCLWLRCWALVARVAEAKVCSMRLSTALLLRWSPRLFSLFTSTLLTHHTQVAYGMLVG